MNALNTLCWLALAVEDYGSGERFERAVGCAEELGADLTVAMALSNLAEHRVHEGRDDEARRLLDRALAGFRDAGAAYATPYALEAAARLALEDGRPELAARVFGAAAALRESTGTPVWPAAVERYERMLGGLGERLGEGQFEQALAEGRALDFDAAIDAALAAVAAPAAQV